MKLFTIEAYRLIKLFTEEYICAWRLIKFRRRMSLEILFQYMVYEACTIKHFILCLEREMFIDHVRLKMFHHVMQ